MNIIQTLIVKAEVRVVGKVTIRAHSDRPDLNVAQIRGQCALKSVTLSTTSAHASKTYIMATLIYRLTYFVHVDGL
jgi:hypothetical protein